MQTGKTNHQIHEHLNATIILADRKRTTQGRKDPAPADATTGARFTIDRNFNYHHHSLAPSSIFINKVESMEEEELSSNECIAREPSIAVISLDSQRVMNPPEEDPVEKSRSRSRSKSQSPFISSGGLPIHLLWGFGIFSNEFFSGISSSNFGLTRLVAL